MTKVLFNRLSTHVIRSDYKKFERVVNDEPLGRDIKLCDIILYVIYFWIERQSLVCAYRLVYIVEEVLAR